MKTKHFEAEYESGQGLVHAPKCVLEQLLPLEGDTETSAKRMVLDLFKGFGWTPPQMPKSYT